MFILQHALFIIIIKRTASCLSVQSQTSVQPPDRLSAPPASPAEAGLRYSPGPRYSPLTVFPPRQRRLLKLHGLSVLTLWRRRRLREHGELLRHMDAAMAREGVTDMSQDELYYVSRLRDWCMACQFSVCVTGLCSIEVLLSIFGL